MKKVIFVIVMILALGLTYLYHEEIVNYVVYNYIYKNKNVLEQPNEYYKNKDYLLIQEADSLYPKNKQDILNIIYTGLDRGWDIIDFYCNKDEYSNCLSDAKDITNDQELLSAINNYISPYNSYTRLSIQINNFGKVEIGVKHLYSDDEIKATNEKVDEIISNNIKDSMSDKEKIKVIHDYIINNTTYDSERSEKMNSEDTNFTYSSNRAYGVLLQGKGICGGYSDAMALFLNKFGIENYKVSSTNHVWNLIKLDGVWYHLDLTWDDPVVNTGENILLDTYFLIDTNDMLNKDTTQHVFNKEYFKEAQ